MEISNRKNNTCNTLDHITLYWLQVLLEWNPITLNFVLLDEMKYTNSHQ